MKPKFTPGPWRYDVGPVEGGPCPECGESFECEDTVGVVRKKDNGAGIASVILDVNQDANAALIAAAPEMYEALEAVEEYFEVKRKPDLYQDPGTLISLLAESAKRLVAIALKKARGGSS